MLWFRLTMDLGFADCGLKNLFQFAQGLRSRKRWLGYPCIAAGRNIQHPQRHFQNPTSVDIFQAAVRYRSAPPYESGMHPHSPAVPWMPEIADFAEIPNMGVVLLSCIIDSAITKGSTIG